MAFGTKRYRRLIVGERVLFWRYLWYDGMSLFAGNNHLLVRPEVGPHRLLRVNFGYGGPTVTPRVVRACVDEAIRRGWPFERAGLTLKAPEIVALGDKSKPG